MSSHCDYAVPRELNLITTVDNRLKSGQLKLAGACLKLVGGTLNVGATRAQTGKRVLALADALERTSQGKDIIAEAMGFEEPIRE